MVAGRVGVHNGEALWCDLRAWQDVRRKATTRRLALDGAGRTDAVRLRGFRRGATTEKRRVGVRGQK